MNSIFFRTDMAIERRDLYKNANKIEDEIDGIECSEEKRGDIKDHVLYLR